MGTPAAADEPPATLSPLIKSIFPRGGQQGSEFLIVVRGDYLSETSAIQVAGSGVRCDVLESSESQVTAQVTIDAAAAVGQRDLRLITPRGSIIQMFQVGALSERMESEPNDDWAKAEEVSLPLIVNGKITAGDYDHFRFEAQAGQVLTSDLNSSRNGTRFDGLLSLLDSEGREIAASDDYHFDKDPHLVHRFDRAGSYILRAYGFGERGSPFSEYRLMLSELPSLAHVFPAGARKGDAVEFVLAGENLGNVEGFLLDEEKVETQILERSSQSVKVRMKVPADLATGYYPLRVRASGLDMPNPLIFAISDAREIAYGGKETAKPLSIEAPLIINGRLDEPRERHNFWIQARAGETMAFRGDGMKLGNFLDPAITIYDQKGGVVGYMDETVPNAFDKDPPSLDFYLVQKFERDGRYRVEMRDAGLRGRPDLIYRLRVEPARPSFEVFILTSQITVLPEHLASLPVRVRRRGGWDAAVEVRVAGLPPGVRSKTVVVEPVNSRFRGTFGEDFFLDGTNVDVPLEAVEGAPAGMHRLGVKAWGTMNGQTQEHAAEVLHPWVPTHTFLRGPTQEQETLLTVAAAPLFDLEAPATLWLSRGQSAEVTLNVRWFSPDHDLSSLVIEPLQLPAGITLERYEAKPGGEQIAVWVRAGDQIEQLSGQLSLLASLPRGKRTYRKASPDVEVTLKKEKADEPRD